MNALPTGLAAAVDLSPLRDFVIAFGELLATARPETPILPAGAALLERLVASDGWLPDAYATPDPEGYRQYLLHCDSRERFSVVSFVWGPGQKTPIHDHRVWGLVGVLRGAETVQTYERTPGGGLHADGEPKWLDRGRVDVFGPGIGDLHRVANALADRPSVSIHVYGGNIGAIRRATYDEAGNGKPFISGYSNSLLPNLWDRSETR